MNSNERISTLSLALLYSFRMLGLFMVLPVLSLYMSPEATGKSLEGATPLLIGLAIGGYGLTQALMQIPFGTLSDRYGRKFLITIGYCLFIAGSLVAAMSDSIYGIILGRVLQGGGAVAACIMALLGDLTSEQTRTRSMAMVGASIGVSFAISIVLGPIVDAYWGINGIFWLTAFLGVIGLIVLWKLVPNPPTSVYSLETLSTKQGLVKSYCNGELQRVYWGVLILHALLTALFIFLPTKIIAAFDIEASMTGWVYLPVVVIGFVFAVPFILVAEVKRQMKWMMVLAVALMLLVTLGLMMDIEAGAVMAVLLLVFFTAFNLMEATLPSLVAKLASAGTRGSAMGLFSSHQFLGAFIGGWLGGMALQWKGESFLLIVCSGLLVVWLLLVLSMKPPKFLKGISVPFVLNESSAEDLAELNRQHGVLEVFHYDEMQTLYIKYDPDLTNEGIIQKTLRCPSLA